MVSIDRNGGAVEGGLPWLFSISQYAGEESEGDRGRLSPAPHTATPTLLPLSVLPMSPDTQPQTLIPCGEPGGVDPTLRFKAAIAHGDTDAQARIWHQLGPLCAPKSTSQGVTPQAGITGGRVTEALS